MSHIHIIAEFKDGAGIIVIDVSQIKWTGLDMESAIRPDDLPVRIREVCLVNERGIFRDVIRRDEPPPVRVGWMDRFQAIKLIHRWRNRSAVFRLFDQADGEAV